MHPFMVGIKCARNIYLSFYFISFWLLSFYYVSFNFISFHTWWLYSHYRTTQIYLWDCTKIEESYTIQDNKLEMLRLIGYPMYPIKLNSRSINFLWTFYPQWGEVLRSRWNIVFYIRLKTYRERMVRILKVVIVLLSYCRGKGKPFQVSWKPYKRAAKINT